MPNRLVLTDRGREPIKATPLQRHPHFPGSRELSPLISLTPWPSSVAAHHIHIPTTRQPRKVLYMASTLPQHGLTPMATLYTTHVA